MIKSVEDVLHDAIHVYAEAQDFFLSSDLQAGAPLNAQLSGALSFENDFAIFEAPHDGDIFRGSNAGDEISTKAGDDILFGQDGNDVLRAGSGDDAIYGGAGSDVMYGGRGDDLIFGGAAEDFVDGGAGNDLIFGGAGPDSLNGGRGNDTIFGGAGRDFISGGNGDDILWGGKGSDYFFTVYGEGVDTIMDFNAEKDYLVVSDRSGLVDELDKIAYQDGDDVVIDYGHGDVTTILNTNISDIDNLIFARNDSKRVRPAIIRSDAEWTRRIKSARCGEHSVHGSKARAVSSSRPETVCSFGFRPK